MCRHFPGPPKGPSNHPVEVGQRTEAIILAEFVRRGYRVLVPFGVNHRYDLVLDLGDRFLRVQCKTGRLKNGCVLFSARSVRSNRRAILERSYVGEANVFAVYCPDTDRVYAVPVENTLRTLGTLRVDPPANHQAKGIRWAADFELPA
jgi:PD-(D/E)XK nuclease superfamily protein